MPSAFDRAIQYCPIRKELEYRGFDLTGRLMALTDLLLQYLGRDHESFLSTKAECVDLRAVIAKAHEELRLHRLAHHC